MKRKKSKLAKLNTKWLKYYKAVGKVFCPALRADIYFTNKGWQHIQQEKWRTRTEKEKRLNLLPQAKHILSKATFFQDRRLQNYHQVPHLHFGFIAHVGGIKIKVVVIEDKGQYDFLSVYRV
jgi:hypothetical protein